VVLRWHFHARQLAVIDCVSESTHSIRRNVIESVAILAVRRKQAALRQAPAHIVTDDLAQGRAKRSQLLELLIA